MIGSREFTRDYHQARRAAGEYAKRLGCLVRLRAVKEYGKAGFVFNPVPREDRQFGADLEGELIRPDDPAWTKGEES